MEMTSTEILDKSTPDDLSGQIDWLLAHPDVSEWLKTALRSAESCDPITLINDLELLRLVLGRRAEEHVARLYAPSHEIGTKDGRGL